MKTEKLKTYYLIIGMVCLCFLTASVGFTFYSMEEYEKKDISHFKENVESMRNSVSNMIKGNRDSGWYGFDCWTDGDNGYRASAADH